MRTDKIPIRNIWLLFLYAADLAKFKNKFDRQTEQAANLPDLIGRILSHTTRERLRRNLNQNYLNRSEVLSRVRGSIDMLKTDAGQLLERGRVHCNFQELSVDTPRNRYVSAALRRLSETVTENETAKACRNMAAEFSKVGVRSQIPSRAELAKDQIGRNETQDKLMLALSKMAFEYSMPSEEEGNYSQFGADLTDTLVRKLFEKAIGNALKIELESKGWTVRQGRKLQWQIQDKTSGISNILPGMQTDIELNNITRNRRIIIDTKFASIFTSSLYQDRILKNNYLYQIYTYVRSQVNDADPLSKTCEGMLLHPQVGVSVNETVNIQGHNFHFKTIDLTLAPSDFEQQLKEIPVL